MPLLDSTYWKNFGPFGSLEYGYRPSKGVYMKVADSNMGAQGLVGLSIEVNNATKKCTLKEEDGTHISGVYAMFRTGGDLITDGDWEVVSPYVMLTLLKRYGMADDKLIELGLLEKPKEA